MNYIMQGIGAFLGVIAGTFVTYGVGLLMEKRTNSQKLKNFKFELEFNLRQLDRWLLDVNGFRNAVNGNALNTWAEWLDLSNIMKSTAEDMFASGLIYSHLDHEQIGSLQVFISDFCSSFEQFSNTKISGLRQSFNQQEAIQFVVFLEAKLRKHKQTIQACIGKLT